MFCVYCLQVKEKQEKDKIETKPDKNEKRGKARGLVTEGPTVPNPLKSVNTEEDECVEGTSSSKLTCDQTSNPASSTNTTPKGHTRRSSKQKVENSNFEEHLPPVATMANNRTMAEMLRAPTEGCAEAIVVPPILAEQFELKYSLINMMTSEQFFGLKKDNPHDHIRWFNKITSTIKYMDVPNSGIKLILFPFSLTWAAYQWLEKEPRIPLPLGMILYKDLFRACPHHGFTELHQLDTFYNALKPADRDSLNAAAGGNLLEKSPQDALTIIENKSKVRNSRNKPIASQVKACDVNSNSEIAKLTHAVNQQTSVVITPITAMLKQLQANPPPASVKVVKENYVTCGGAHPYYQCLAVGGNTFLEFRDNIQGYVSAAAGNYNQGNPGYRRQGVANQMRPLDMVENELRNEMKTSIQTSLSNQTNEIKNMMASILQMNIASTFGSGSLRSNTVANPKGVLKAITTRSGLVTDGPTVPTPPTSITSEVGERVEETYTDPDLDEYTIKVPHPPVKKYKPPELKCKALADLGASINLVPLSVWRELGLPELIPTRMTLELANHAICTHARIARDVFVPVGKFTFPADFVVVDYESDPKVPLILGRPFLRTARALIDVHGEEMILRDGDERLTLNMKHDMASYSNHPHKESVNLINIFNISSEDFLEVLVSNQQSGNPTFLPHPELTLPEVTNDIFDSEGCNVLSEKLLDFDSTKDLHSPFHDNSLSGKIEFLLYQDKDSSLKDSIDQKGLANIDAIFVDPIPEMFTDQHAPDYSSPSIFNVYDDDFLEVESDARNVYDNPFDSKGEKIKEFTLLIDELDLPCDFLFPSEYDSFNSQDFSRVDVLPLPNNEDKVFNLGILIQEKPVKIITRVVQNKKLAISNASLVFEDFDPLFYEPLFFKDVSKSKMLLLFSSKNKEKVFKPGIYTSGKLSSIPENMKTLVDFVLKSSFPLFKLGIKTKNDSVKLEVSAKQGLFGNPKSSHVQSVSFSPIRS
nr:reverse transcriptase domain-containing protein [Tanacetum cinerariifolium]